MAYLDQHLSMHNSIKEVIKRCGSDYGAAAHGWTLFGFTVTPLVPRKKIPAVKREPWLQSLALTKIHNYWQAHPDHEIAAIVDEQFIVLDADTDEAVEAVIQIEEKFGVRSNLVVRTTKGQHRYYKLAKGTRCRTQSHSTLDHPERIDIKAEHSTIVLPPSTGKLIVRGDIQSIEDLVEVGPNFIAAVYRHNGVDLSSELELKQDGHRSSGHGGLSVEQMRQLLAPIDPDQSYDDWTRIGMALYNETDGSDGGLDLFDKWSSGGKKYGGRSEIEYKWRSYYRGVGQPVTAGTLIYMARESGADVSKILGYGEAEFEVIPDQEHQEKPPDDSLPQSESISKGAPKDDGYPTPLHKFSLRGMSGELEKNRVGEVYVLLGIALLAQLTVLFGSPNVGKTLLVLWLLKEAIKAGRVDPDKIFYINEDDNLNGLITKNGLVEKHGIHMLSSGYLGLKRGDTLKLIQQMAADGNCTGVVIILDTAKKFVDVMDKRSSSIFSTRLRQFVKKGGTVIVLAHTNKRPDKNGQGIPGGTSDLLDDADAGYVLNVIDDDQDGKRKVVQFAEVKSRGGQDHCTTFQYSTAKGITYEQRLCSVERLTDERQKAIEDDRIRQQDQSAIDAVMRLIAKDVTTKMDLVKHTSTETNLSHAKIKEVIERYVGELWQFRTEARGKQVFSLITPSITKLEYKR
ncbi:MAG: AAA family ATPase [Candidatus Marinimicrobia bacterium]|nr:AAA family ATPase [Candidatus Neomarinimicrobiota bacterium]